jgi:hypothetical protein
MSAKKIEGFDILEQFLKYYSFFKLGGDLLPDLIQFYQWLHRDLSNLITVEEARTKTLYHIVDEFSSRYSDQFAMSLYIKVRGTLYEGRNCHHVSIVMCIARMGRAPRREVVLPSHPYITHLHLD